MKVPGSCERWRRISFSREYNHIDISRSMAFVAEGKTLEPEEHSHLFRCEDCMNRTVDAVFEEIERRREARKTA
jgi:hypothetical protein